MIERLHYGLHRALPPGHWQLAAADAILGALLTAEGRFEEAEPCLIASHELLLAVRGEHASYTSDARRWIEELYVAWGQPEKAAPFKSSSVP